MMLDVLDLSAFLGALGVLAVQIALFPKLLTRA